MHTLLMRLEGPMQSWGIQSWFTERDTVMTPSKSGVTGLICAALGRPRTDPIQDLANLKMGVRADREGIFMKDFQTAQNVAKAKAEYDRNGFPKTVDTVISNRYFISDACFLIGLESGGSDLELLRKIQSSLQSPFWHLFLGRKSYLPSKSVWLADGLQLNTCLADALDPNNYGWLGKRTWDNFQVQPDKLRLVLEDPKGAEMRPDQPITYESSKRRHSPHAPRYISTSFVSLPQNEPLSSLNLEACGEPDLASDRKQSKEVT